MRSALEHLHTCCVLDTQGEHLVHTCESNVGKEGMRGLQRGQRVPVFAAIYAVYAHFKSTLRLFKHFGCLMVYYLYIRCVDMLDL